MRDAFRRPRSALVLGGGSDIARAALSRLGSDGLTSAALAVRSPAAVRLVLDRNPLDIPTVRLFEWNARRAEDHRQLMRDAAAAIGDLDLVICAVGRLGHGTGFGTSATEAAQLFADNFSGPAAAVTAAADHLVEQGHGVVVVISSVAGLRVRRSNYLYGAAKAGLDGFTRGLAEATRHTSVRVHLIRPGFVRSKMTAGLPEAPFAVTPERVADAIGDVVLSDRNRVVHVPAALGPLFLALRVMPEPLWRRVAGDR